MLRYIIGITIITTVIMIIRRLSDGKMLKRHQYAMWIIVPVCMVIFPFLKIDVPVPEAISSIIPVSTETAADIAFDKDSYAAIEADKDGAEELSIDQITSDGIVSREETVTDKEVTSGHVFAKDAIKPVDIIDWGKLAENVIHSVSVLIIILLFIYNSGFVIYCMRNSKYIGRDPVSGLKIFGIDHKGTPFLLFNRIYVDLCNEQMEKYKADREVYIEDHADRMKKYVICHEACHFKHGDFIWVIVRHLVLAINWYNPVIWLAFILSGRDCELACDEEVISISGEESSLGYAESLINLLKQKSELRYGFTMTTGMRGGYKTMKNRILSIANPSKKSYKSIVIGMVAVFVISSCFVLEPRAAETEQAIEDTGIISELSPDELSPDDVTADVISGGKEQDVFFYRNNTAVKGKLKLPEGEGPFRTVIMCSILPMSYYDEIARRFNDYGYATIQFEATNSYGIGAETLSVTSDSGIGGEIVSEMILDLSTVMDGLRYLPDVDRSSIYLWGHSLGGFVTSYVGIHRQKDIRGIILYDPYLPETQYISYDHDSDLDVNGSINICYMFGYCDIPAVLIAESDYINKDQVLRAAKHMSNDVLVVVNGKDLYSDEMYDQLTDKAVISMAYWE